MVDVKDDKVCVVVIEQQGFYGTKKERGERERNSQRFQDCAKRTWVHFGKAKREDGLRKRWFPLILGVGLQVYTISGLIFSRIGTT